MALVTTTISGALPEKQNYVVVASATSITPGMLGLLDQEWVVVQSSYVVGSTTVGLLRGKNSSKQEAHVTGANITFGLASDFSAPGPQASTNNMVAGRVRTLTSYSASGAITLPVPGTDAIAVLNGTSTLAMTIAVPTKDMDGCILYVVGNGKSQSTVDTATTVGYGNAGSSYDRFTFQNAGNVTLSLMAVNGFWSILNTPITGTSTALSVAIA